MGRAWAVAVFAVGLLALSAIVVGSDSSDAAPTKFAGYVKYDNKPFHDPGAKIVITEVSGAPESYVFVAKHEFTGIDRGKFQFELELNLANAYLFNISVNEYTLGTLPAGGAFPNYDMQEYSTYPGGPPLKGGYRMNVVWLLAHGEKDEEDGDAILVTGGPDSVATIAMAQLGSYTLSGVISAGDFKIPGAKVELIDIKDGIPTKIGEDSTDRNGRYHISFRPGMYELKVTADRYKSVELEADLRDHANATMNVADMEAVKGADIPRTLMYAAAITGALMIVASIAYRVYLRRNPEKSIIYDDSG